MRIWSWFKQLLGAKSNQSPRRPERESSSSLTPDQFLEGRQPRPATPVPVRQRPSMTAAQMLERIAKLQEANAQWPEIWKTLNPDNNPRVEELLVKLRGPHMFAPHVGLNMIEIGCRRAIASDPNAERTTALKAALQDGETIIRPE